MTKIIVSNTINGGIRHLPVAVLSQWQEAKRVSLYPYISKEPIVTPNWDKDISIDYDSIELVKVSVEELDNFLHEGNGLDKWALSKKDLGESSVWKDVKIHNFIYDISVDTENINRTDPQLIELLESQYPNYRSLGVDIVQIPDNVDWYIGGSLVWGEWVAEKHRVWTPKRNQMGR